LQKFVKLEQLAKNAPANKIKIVMSGSFKNRRRMGILRPGGDGRTW
jgi:hypothetical protein